MIIRTQPDKKIYNEESLSYIDRLGLAWCRLNNGEWDPILGDKPDGFDSIPDNKPFWRFWDKRPDKSTAIINAMRAIEEIIGKANTSRCWWIFELGRTEDEWFLWYIREGCRD